MNKFVTILAVIAFVAGLVHAGEIVENVIVTFKNGQEVGGNITGKDIANFFIESSGSNMTFPLSQVQEIKRAGAKEYNNITIKGNVIFDEFKEGIIVVSASRIKKFLDGCVLASQVIDKPGPYELFIPRCPDKVWVKAFNSIDRSGLNLESDPEFKYKNNPVVVEGDSRTIAGIDLYIKRNKE